MPDTLNYLTFPKVACFIRSQAFMLLPSFWEVLPPTAHAGINFPRRPAPMSPPLWSLSQPPALLKHRWSLSPILCQHLLSSLIRMSSLRGDKNAEWPQHRRFLAYLNAYKTNVLKKDPESMNSKPPARLFWKLPPFSRVVAESGSVSFPVTKGQALLLLLVWQICKCY